MAGPRPGDDDFDMVTTAGGGAVRDFFGPAKASPGKQGMFLFREPARLC